MCVPLLIVGSRIDANVESRWAYIPGNAMFASEQNSGELFAALKKPEVTAGAMRKTFGAGRRGYFHAGIAGKDGYA